MKLNPFLFLVVTTLIITSCISSPPFFEQNQSITGQNWTVANKVNFNVEIKDTSALYHFFVNIRHTGEYKYSNLYLFLDTKFPDGNSYRDTVECVLAQPNGKWYGNGLGDVFDNSILFRTNVTLPQKGEYQFTLQQGMREDDLPHIMDIGLKIKRGS